MGRLIIRISVYISPRDAERLELITLEGTELIQQI